MRYFIVPVLFCLAACSPAQLATANTDAAAATAIAKIAVPLVGASVPGAAVILSAAAQASCIGQAAANTVTAVSTDPKTKAASSEASVLLGDACTW